MLLEAMLAPVTVRFGSEEIVQTDSSSTTALEWKAVIGLIVISYKSVSITIAAEGQLHRLTG
jgi:hypothetical protein